MADKEANLIIRLKDEASKGLGNIKGSVLALSAAVAGLTAFLVDSFKSFLESDKAVVKLNANLKAQGIFTEQLSKEMQNYARELQKQTTVSDEAILKSIALSTTFGIAGQQLKQTTKAALDLSTGLGVDLQTATLLLGKAAAGETGTLSRYGIVIADNIPPTEKFAEVLKQIGERFGGTAQADAESYAGRIANLANRFDDIKETIGEALIPAFEKLLGIVEFFIGGIEELGGIFPATFATGLAVIQQFIQGLEIAVAQIPFLTDALGLVGVNFQAINEALQVQIDSIINLGIQEKITNQERILNNEMMTQTMINNMNRLKAEEKKASDKRLADIKKNLNEEVAYNRKVEDQIAADRKKEHDAEILRQQTRAQNFQATLQFISSLSQSENKTLAAIGKAAAISQATIDTYVAANRALSSVPPPYNFILASLVTTAGLANVARISGVKMAEGGIVMPRMGGIQATIGEGGSAEAVIPLNSDSAREKMQAAGIGSNVTINMNVGTLVGSEDSVRELAKMIDKELFSLRRNNESIAFEAI